MRRLVSGCWSHIPHCWKSHALAHLSFLYFVYLLVASAMVCLFVGPFKKGFIEQSYAYSIVLVAKFCAEHIHMYKCTNQPGTTKRSDPELLARHIETKMAGITDRLLSNMFGANDNKKSDKYCV